VVKESIVELRDAPRQVHCEGTFSRYWTVQVITDHGSIKLWRSAAVCVCGPRARFRVFTPQSHACLERKILERN